MPAARALQGGESFGLAIAEFSVHNRPVLTSAVHHDNHSARFHIDTLGAKGLFYEDMPSLLRLILGFDRLDAKRHDWNAYSASASAHPSYSPLVPSHICMHITLHTFDMPAPQEILNRGR